MVNKAILILLLLAPAAVAEDVMAVFTATWCVPCQQYKQELVSYSEPARLVFVDIDRHPVVKAKNRVRVVPTTIWYSDRKEVARATGPLKIQQVRDISRAALRKAGSSALSTVRKAKQVVAAAVGGCKCGPECQCVNCNCN